MSEIEIDSINPELTKALERYFKDLGSPPLSHCNVKPPTTCPTELWRSCPIRRGIQHRHAANLAELAAGNTEPEPEEVEDWVSMLVHSRCSLENAVGFDLTTGRKL